MYRQLNEEINTTPVAVKTILCLTCVTTLMLIIMFAAFLASLSDLGTLVEQSLTIMKHICKKDPALC